MGLVLNILIFMVFITITGAIAIFWEDIVTILFPNKYKKVIMFEKSGNIKIMTINTKDKIYWKWRGGVYYWYYPRIKEGTESAQTEDYI